MKQIGEYRIQAQLGNIVRPRFIESRRGPSRLARKQRGRIVFEFSQQTAQLFCIDRRLGLIKQPAAQVPANRAVSGFDKMQTVTSDLLDGGVVLNRRHPLAAQVDDRAIAVERAAVSASANAPPGFKHDAPPSGCGEIAGGDRAGQAGADYEHVKRLIAHEGYMSSTESAGNSIPISDSEWLAEDSGRMASRFLPCAR